ncbi:hypothetical protein V1527DRAFT_481983 [Lipomyces starkeyi]
MEQIPLYSSPSEELNRRNRLTVRIAVYDCGTEGQYNGGDEVQTVGGSGDLELNEVNTNLSESFLMGSWNGLQDMAIEADGYDDIEQVFKSGFNIRTGNNYCLQVCN